MHTATSIAAQATSGDASGLALAAVNGTILAVVAAIVGGYYLIVFQALDNMETGLVEIANNMNSLGIGSIVGPEVPAGTLSMEDLLTLFKVLADERHIEPSLEGKVDLPNVNEKGRRGKILAATMSAIASTYPFCEGTEPTTPTKREPLKFQDVEDIRGWLPKAEEIVGRLAAYLDWYRSGLEELGPLADIEDRAELDERIKGLNPERRDELLQRLPFGQTSAFFRAFGELVVAAYQIAQSARVHLDQIQRYQRRRLPPKRTVVAFVAVGFAVLLCGVAIPMLHPSVSSVIAAWVPAFVYVACGVYAGIQIIRRYGRRV